MQAERWGMMGHRKSGTQGENRPASQPSLAGFVTGIIGGSGSCREDKSWVRIEVMQ